jgi:hypothetical protein
LDEENALIKKQDKYMYIAKEKGKNEVCASVTGKGSKKYGKKKEATYSR